jgi:hypothetical protein
LEFTVICPNDGPIEVGLDRISTIVFRGFDSISVVFVCPECGAEIQVGLQTPELPYSGGAFERFGDSPFAFEVNDPDTLLPAPRERTLTSAEQELVERYCEYFRRQLASVDDADSSPERRAHCHPPKLAVFLSAHLSGRASTAPARNPPTCARYATPPEPAAV